MKATRRIMVVAAASAALFAGSSLVAAAPAMAYPQNCSATTFVGSYGRSYCTHGSGSHRVAVRCARPGSQLYTVYGPWVGTGHTSTAYCNARTSSVQTQGD